MSSGKPRVVPVSELFDRLVAEFRGASIPHSNLFQAALRVCAEDSKRVQRGEPPSQVRALVQRARAILEVSHPSASLPPSAGWSPAAADAAPIRFTGGQKSPAQEPPPTASAAGDSPESPDPAPVSSVSEFEFTPEEPGRPLPGEIDAAPPPPVVPRPPAPLDASPPEPGNPTAPAVTPLAPHVEPISPVLALRESRVSFEDLFSQEPDAETEDTAPEGGGLSSLVFRIGVIALALLAGAVVIVVLWPGMAPRKSVPPRIVESFPAPEPTAFRPPLPATPVAPTPAPAAPPTPAPTRTPTPAPTQLPPEAAAPSRPPATNRPAVIDGAETMRVPDWAGRAPAFVVHFASYRSRDNALADASRLGRDLARPAHALRVDLGEKGTWYRVVVGDFATAEEARAFRAGIVARKTGDVGPVYRVVAP